MKANSFIKGGIVMYGSIMKKLRSKDEFMYKRQLRSIEKARQNSNITKIIICER